MRDSLPAGISAFDAPRWLAPSDAFLQALFARPELADADARDNYRAYLAFRDELVRAGTLEAYYLAFLRAGRTDVPPVFIEHVVSAIVERVIGAHVDAFERRAAQLLHRPQRVALEGGRVRAADREVADGLSRSAGFDVLGALREDRAAEVDAALPVLGADDVDELATDDDLRSFVLDLSHEMTRDVGHGLAFTLARAHSGQAALARVLERS